jgi:hypothetical protein
MLVNGRVLDDVVRREHHHLAQAAADVVLVVTVGEVLAGQARGQVGDDAVRIDAVAGTQDRVAIDVGGENLDCHLALHAFHAFQGHDGQGVGFLAAGAAGDPEAQFLASVGLGDDVG